MEVKKRIGLSVAESVNIVSDDFEPLELGILKEIGELRARLTDPNSGEAVNNVIIEDGFSEADLVAMSKINVMRRLAKTKPGISLAPQVKFKPGSKNQELWRRYTRIDRNPPREGTVSSVSTRLHCENQTVYALYSPESDKFPEEIIIQDENLRAVLSLGKERSQLDINYFNGEKPSSFRIIYNHEAQVPEKREAVLV